MLFCSTQNLGIRDKGQVPGTFLKTQPSQPGPGRVSVAGPWKRLAVGVVGGRIEVEVGEGGGERRQRASLRGGGFRGTASPAQQPWVETPGGRGEGSQPGEESQEQRGQKS